VQDPQRLVAFGHIQDDPRVLGVGRVAPVQVKEHERGPDRVVALAGVRKSLCGQLPGVPGAVGIGERRGDLGKIAGGGLVTLNGGDLVGRRASDLDRLVKARRPGQRQPQSCPEPGKAGVAGRR
jgi:hypothetical protein